MGIVQSEVEPQAGAVRPVASDRTNIVTVVLGTWFTIGLLLDAWAHNNVPNLETFFTPWHAAFYSGFAATAAWIAWTVRDGLRGGRFDVRAVPLGYASSAVAVVGFALAGGADLAWHTAFGVEQQISILFSPSHIGLVASMLVIVTTPVRAMWADRSLAPAPGLRRLLPAVLSTALAATLVLLFIQYANAEIFQPRAVMAALSNVEPDHLVASMALTNLVLVAPLLTLARRWVLPFGTATALAILTGALSAAVSGFRALDTIAGIVVGAVAVDVLSSVLRPTPDRLVRYRAFGGLAALFLWCGYLIAAYAAAGPYVSAPGEHPESTLELVTGTPLVQCGFGILLAVLLVPSRPATSL